MTQYIAPKGNYIVHNVAPDYWYRPVGSNGIVHDHSKSYVAPSGDQVDFNFSYVTELPDGYAPTFDLSLVTPDEPYLPTFDLNLGEYTPVEPEIPTPTVMVTPYKLGWGKATPISTTSLSKYEKANPINVTAPLSYQRNVPLSKPFLSKTVKLLNSIDKPYLLKRDALFDKLDVPYHQVLLRDLKPQDINYKLIRLDQFNDLSTPNLSTWTQPPEKDTQYKLIHNAVRLYGVDRIPIYPSSELVLYEPTLNINLTANQGYVPTLDLNLVSQTEASLEPKPYVRPNPHELSLNLDELYTGSLTFDLPGEYITPDEGDIIGYELTPIQPTGTSFITKAGKPDAEINYTKHIPWGYGLNNFVIGGQWRDIYGGDTTPPVDPDEPINHPDYGVFQVVNTVNIFALPSNTALNFETLSMSIDVDSFVWSATFDVLDENSYKLIKPEGRNIKSINVVVNGRTFKLFVSAVRRNVSANANDGKVTTTYSCQAYSSLKLLAYPYSAKKSYSANTDVTAAVAVNDLATSKVFTSEWQTVNWNIPASVYSYQDKTPLGAILDVVNSVGGVIVPDDTEDAFTVYPRFPVSPWLWYDAGTIVDRTMDEARFFSISNSPIPKDNPDGVFVYGAQDGVGVRAIRNGRPGTALLPDVVDKYITSVAAGQERARIEVAKNSFLEMIPMSTYVDEFGLVDLLDLIEFTETNGVDKWRGQVMSFKLDCIRTGTALVQTITVARFYDDE